MTNTKQILQNARSLIGDREHWTYGSHAQSRDGSENWFSDPEAYCFCLDGAVAKVAGVKQDEDGEWLDTTDYDPAAALLRQAAFDLFGTPSYVAVNDGEAGALPDNGDPYDAMYANTLQVLDLAIQRA